MEEVWWGAGAGGAAASGLGQRDNTIQTPRERRYWSSVGQKGKWTLPQRHETAAPLAAHIMVQTL